MRMRGVSSPDSAAALTASHDQGRVGAQALPATTCQAHEGLTRVDLPPSGPVVDVAFSHRTMVGEQELPVFLGMPAAP